MMRLWSVAFMVPCLRPFTYRPRRATPWESIPRRSARTRTSVVTRASSAGTPSFARTCSQNRRSGFSCTVKVSAIPALRRRNRRELARISLRFPCGIRSTFSVEFLPKGLRCAFSCHGDDDPWQPACLLPQESLGAPSILLPALPEPRANRTPDPEFLIVQKFLQELERPIEFARPDESVECVGRCASPPDVLRASPSKDLSESGSLRAHHPRDRAGGKAVAQSPSGRGVDPAVREFPRVVVENLFVPAEEENPQRLLFEGGAGPERAGEGVHLGRAQGRMVLCECREGPAHRRHAHAEDRHRRTDIRLEIRGSRHFWRFSKLLDELTPRGPDVERHRFRGTAKGHKGAIGRRAIGSRSVERL